jgi:HYR domain
MGRRHERARLSDWGSTRRCGGAARRLRAVVVAAVLIALGTASAAATGASELASGELALRANLKLDSLVGACSPPPGGECGARSGSGLVPGLGAVTEKYDFPVGLGPPSCAVGFGEALASSNRFVVAGKGEIAFALADGGCVAVEEPIYNQTQAYTITGGTGIYAGASGTGTVERKLGRPTATGRHGPETWTGTLSVPGIEFDTTPPTLHGATNRTVRVAKGAKTALVRFSVSARDDRDGPVAVRCTPRSGSRFRVGRTKVTCKATDSSANTATASLTVTVRVTK